MIWLLAVALTLLPEIEGVRRVQAHLLIEDASSALKEAELLAQKFPESVEVGINLVQALAVNGMEERALALWNKLALKDPNLMGRRDALEELAWGVLKKGIESTQQGIRLSALIGSYLTNDVRAVPVLRRMMRDSNAVIRSVAIQMAPAYRDAILKDEIQRLMVEEKVWMVRLEAIKAVGALKMRSLAPLLKNLVQSDKTTYEERHFAIGSLIEMYDTISQEEFNSLAHSNRAGLRHLAASVVSHLQVPWAKEEIFHLIQDSHRDVRIAAINTFALCYRYDTPLAEAKDLLRLRLTDSDPAVAITAAWAAHLMDPSWGEPFLAAWLKDSLPENRRLAAAALAASGPKGISLAEKTLKESNDPYVKANIALGLLGQRASVAPAADFLYQFLQEEKRMWMWDNRPNPLFQILAPSQIRHVDQIPNYPEAIDQMTRLNLVSLLALVDDPRAVPALKTFLQRKGWGLTGVAAATLLQEGDESALEGVKELLSDPDENVRLQACLVLAFYGRDASVLRELQGAYAGADHEKKLHILEALGRIGHPDSFSFFVSVLNEPFPILRVAAAAALIQGLSR